MRKNKAPNTVPWYEPSNKLKSQKSGLSWDKKVVAENREVGIETRFEEWKPPLKLQNILTLPESARATGIWAISDSEDCLNILFIFYSLFLSGKSTQNLGNISLLWQSISSFFVHTSRLCGRWSKSNGRALEGWMLGKVACAGTCRKSRLWCGTCLCT